MLLAKRRRRTPTSAIDFDFDWEDQKTRSKKSRKNPKLGEGYFKVDEYRKHPELNGKYRNCDIAEILRNEPIQPIAVQELKHNLHLAEWDDSEGKMFSAQQYITDPENPKFREHHKRIKNADLQYPIYLWKDGDTNQFFLIDGMHRYVQVLLVASTNQKINAKILTDDHLRVLQSPLKYLILAMQEEIYLDRYLSTVVRKRVHPFTKTKDVTAKH